MLSAAEYLFTNALSRRSRLELQDKRRFKTLLFPDGLAYSKNEGFGNPVSNPLVAHCDVLREKSKEMAPQAGVESNIRKLIPWLKRAYYFDLSLEEGAA